MCPGPHRVFQQRVKASKKISVLSLTTKLGKQWLHTQRIEVLLEELRGDREHSSVKHSPSTCKAQGSSPTAAETKPSSEQSPYFSTELEIPALGTRPLIKESAIF